MKLTKSNVSKRFRWSRYYPKDKAGHPAVRLTCGGDGKTVKVTYCRDLTPEELADVGKWFQGVAKDLKALRASYQPKRRAKAA